MSDLIKKNIVIIGGAGRLGQVFVSECINYYNVIVLDVCSRDSWLALNITAEDFIQTDINDPDSLGNAINHFKREQRLIDAVVNTSYPRNANYGKSLFDVSLNDFNDNINLHLGGYFHVMKIFAELFIEQGYGNLINIASIQGVFAPKFEHYYGTNMGSPIEYTASKSAIIAMSRYFAKYLKGNNIRINCISPGGILDNQPSSFTERYRDSCINKGMLDAEDIVGAVKYLLSDESKFINGQNIIIDDGWSL
jgi:NAD(P)-dependent dehydrogenase (short-subunit alcohol dehydrogenase family)